MGLFSKEKPQKSLHELDNDLNDSGNIDFGSNADYKMTAEKSDTISSGVIIDKPKTTKKANLSYGIEEAILLMRDLPTEPIELVVKVVKTTLESIDVKVSDIIQDAKAKEKTIENRITQLKSEINNYEEKIKKLKDSINLLEKDQAETKRVKEHLLLAKDNTQSEKSTEAGNKSTTTNPSNSVTDSGTQNLSSTKDEKPQSSTISGSQTASPPHPQPGSHTSNVDKAS